MEKGKNTMHQYVKSTLISVLFGEIVTALMLFLFALLICKLDIPLRITDILVVAAASLGSLTAGYCNGRLIKEKGLIFGLLCGGIQLFILLIFNLGFYHFLTPAFFLIKVCTMLILSAIGGILGVNKRPKRIKC